MTTRAPAVLKTVELKIEVLTQFAPYFSFLMTLMTPCGRPAPFDIKRISQKIWPWFDGNPVKCTSFCNGARGCAFAFLTDLKKKMKAKTGALDHELALLTALRNQFLLTQISKHIIKF